jgi:hypothetical protein
MAVTTHLRMPFNPGCLLPNACFIHLRSHHIQQIERVINTCRSIAFDLRYLFTKRTPSRDGSRSSRFGLLDGLLRSLGSCLDLCGLGSLFFSEQSRVFSLARKFGLPLFFLVLLARLAPLYIILPDLCLFLLLDLFHIMCDSVDERSDSQQRRTFSAAA